MVLQMFCDDSGSSAQEPYYVLAGFVAEYDAWEKFQKDWSALLGRHGLRYFKMREANRFDGQFNSGWNPSRRDAVVYEFAEMNRKYAALRVSAYVKREDFDSIMLGAAMGSTDYNEPYGILFWSICRQVIEKQYRAGDENPCDFIFDQQGIVGLKAQAWWPEWESWIHPDRKHLLGSPPIFRDDVDVVPIQAADLYAWTVRNALCGGANEKWQAQAVQKVIDPIENFEMYWDRDRLHEHRATLALNHISFFERKDS